MEKAEFIKNKIEFIDYLKFKNKSLHTQKVYKLDLNQLLSFWNFYENQINEVFNLEEIIIKYLDMLYQIDLSPSSIARKISCFNSFKKFLKIFDIKLNVKFKRPIVRLKDPKTLAYHDLIKILDLTDIDLFPTRYPFRDKSIIELLYATGILCSEITRIELQHINFKNNTIIIRNKNRRDRVVIFGNKAAQYIQKYIEHERISIKSTDEKLFLNCKNRPLGIRSIQRICQMFRLYLEDNQSLTPYILRNSFALHMLNNGMELEQVQKLLGHKTRSSTERYILKKKN